MSAERETRGGDGGSRIGALVFRACEVALLACVARGLWLNDQMYRARALAGFQFDYGEGNVLATLARIAHGLTAYPDPRAFPNAIDPYGPVGYYLLALPVKLWGTTFLLPRSLIAALAAVTCVLLALTLARRTGMRLAAVAFGFLYVTLARVQDWSALLRVDFVGLALTMAGVYAFCRGEAHDSERESGDSDLGGASRPTSKPGIWFAVVLFTGALFCKFSLLAAPAACALYLAIQKRWLDVLRFIAGIAALCAAGLAAMELVTHGRFAEHLLLTHPDPFSWPAYALRITDIAHHNPALVALACGLVVCELLRRKLTVASLWFILATLSATTAGKQGSGWNHFLEWQLAMCLCAGVFWAELPRMKLRTVALAVALGATLWLCIGMLRRGASDVYTGNEECAAAYNWVKQHPGDRVLAENVGALLLGGKTVWVLDPFVYSQIVMAGTWPDTVIEPRLREEWYDLVVTSQEYPRKLPPGVRGTERFSAGMLGALGAHYRVVKTFQCADARVMYEPASGVQSK